MHKVSEMSDNKQKVSLRETSVPHMTCTQAQLTSLFMLSMENRRK